METTIEVREDGSLTLTASLLKYLNLLPGDRMHVVAVEGALVLVPEVRSVTELAETIDRARREAGLDMDDLLASLRDERTRYVAEKYGIVTE
jgi:antitoxin component of MazEF toxin-antitoxin module